MAGALAELVEGLGQQRRRAGDEEAHAAAGLARQAGLGEQPHVERRHAHEDGRLGQPGDDRLRIELGEPDHPAAVEQRAVRGDEQAVHVEDRQCMDQHVAFAPAPVGLQRDGVRQQVGMAEHRALAAAGGARGVEDGGQVVAVALGRLVRLRLAGRGVEQRAGAVVVEGVDVLRAGGLGDARHPVEVPRRADDDAGLGIADEVLDLAGLVGVVQRQVDMARAQHRQVEHQRLDRLLGLHGDARAFGQRQRGEQVGDARARLVEVAPAVAARRRAVDGLDGGGVEVGRKTGAQGGVEVVVAGHGGRRS